MLKHVYVLLLIFFFALNIHAQEAVIIDHNCTDISKIPDNWILKAKDSLRIGYGHTSHGSQLITGIEAYREGKGSKYYYSYSSYGLETGKFINDYWGNAGGADDLGHNGDLGWQNASIYMLNLSNNDRNVVIWSWCGGVSDNSQAGIKTYLDAMSELEDLYPDVTFVYMTGHLDGSGAAGNLNKRNNQIRDYCEENNKFLFDFADIESYDPDGNYFLDIGADDGCYYNGGNWAEEWLAHNPNSDLADRVNKCGTCAHSQRLNCVLKGAAFWWLMARIAGWEGDSEQRSLQITSPNGGENWLVSSKHTITWVSQGEVGNIIIEYSTDNGDNWETIVSSTKNDNIYYWEVPSIESADCLVRISEINGTLMDTSDNSFEITSSIVRNMNLSIQASRGEERAWLIQRQYGEILLAAENIGSLAVSKYIIYRKEVRGVYNIIREVADSEAPGGRFVYYDKYLDSTKTYVYRAAALGIKGQILASSNEETI